MAYAKDSTSAAVRAHLDHPVIDGDGHWLEPVPIFLDYLRQVGGPSVVERFIHKAREAGWYEMRPHERMDHRIHRPTWWGEPAHTLDRATARALNLMNAEMFRPYAQRMTPAAIVPVYTPQEASAEATYAVQELGMKVIMIANHVRRPVAVAAQHVTDPAHARIYIDSLGLDSAYDYDPFWATCVDLKVAVTALSQPQVCDVGRGSGLGLQPAHRFAWALGETPCARHGGQCPTHEPRHHAARRTLRPLWRQDISRQNGRADGLPEPGDAI